MLSALDRRHTVAPPGYSRWLIPPAALAIHLCIGQVYATSVYKNSLIAHFDTGQTAIGVIFSIAMVMLGVGMVLYVLLALFGQTATALFVLLACVILSFYGGGFATVPAYLRDLFGTFEVGAIHGRLLTAWSAAGVAGPLIVNAFLDAQGKPGTLTAAAYRPALFTMVGVLAVGFVANLLIRPVPERFHEPASGRDGVEGAQPVAAERSGS